MRDHLLRLLEALDGVSQDARHHPEGDALYHSLQVFQQALESSDDGVLLAAALFHDIGKSLGLQDHAEAGARLLEGLVAPRIVWLVRHHMDLLHDPRRTRRRLRDTPQLQWLEALRRWDDRGRDPNAAVMPPEEALDILLEHHPELFNLPALRATHHHEEEYR